MPKALPELATLALSILCACSAPAQSTSRGSASPEGAGAAAVPAATGSVIPKMSTCAPDNPFCETDPLVTGSAVAGSGGPLIGTSTSCGSLPIDLTPASVNIMIAVDGAASMKDHWPDIAAAVRSLRANNPSASFGLHHFWADPVDPLTEEGWGALNTTNNGCSEYHNEIAELGNYSADELVTLLGDGPRGGTIFDLYQVGPLLSPLNETYLLSQSALADPNRTNYLVVFTSANDNCFGTFFIANEDKLQAFRKLALELSKRNIRLIPVGVNEAAMPQDGFGPGLTGTTARGVSTDYEVLGAMLDQGGTSLEEVPRIDTPENLAKLVSVVGQAVNNCRFALPETLDASMSVNPFEISFSINGKVVPRDRAERSGWNFVRGSTSQVEFFGQGCEALQAGMRIEAGKSCATDICGTAAVSVSTRPRKVLLLLDSSASRTECADGSIDCFSQPGSEGRPLSFWEVVQHAVSDVLVAPINSDVAFGMQFFPDKNASELSCEVASAPEIEAAPGTQIQIMKAMLEKLPFGLSPVVGVMESVAAAPGNLADPNVLGAVVLLSDGGDNCSGEAQPMIVSRLGAAAKSLLDRGVRTFAIRYGSVDGQSPEQAEQLSAIANEGGTALSGGQFAYIDAKSPKELEDALAGISDQLSSCAFMLGEVAAGVDRNRTNLFLDGEQIGFDAMGTNQEGWKWVDQAQTTIELLGNACNLFKTSPTTNIIVEFGCEQVIQVPD